MIKLLLFIQVYDAKSELNFLAVVYDEVNVLQRTVEGVSLTQMVFG